MSRPGLYDKMFLQCGLGDGDGRGGFLAGSRAALGHPEAPDMPAGRSVRNVAANDRILIYKECGVYRRGSSGVIVDLIHVAHDFFSGVPGQVIALGFLQGIVPVKHFPGLIGNFNLAGFFGRCGHIPAEVCKKFDSGVIS